MRTLLYDVAVESVHIRSPDAFGAVLERGQSVPDTRYHVRQEEN